MFDHAHYVPILRWKQAEWTALQHLKDTDRALTTPLIELVPKAFNSESKTITTVDGRLSKIAEDIFEYWGQDPLFVDLWLLPSELRVEDGGHPLSVLGKRAWSYQLPLIPVTGLERDAAYHAAVLSLVEMNQQGACVRLLLDDIDRPGLANDLEHLLGCLGLYPEKVDLLVDCQITGDSDPTYANLCEIIPNIHSWRTFTVASGSFPADLTGFEKNRQHKLTRSDWLTWRNQVTTAPALPRIPTYSDYTIRHPKYSEPSGYLPNYSGSIRYTFDEYWVIMRGEGVRNPDGPGFAQWPANAQLLRERPEFCGANFSYGDQYIEKMGMQLKRTGNAMTWLRAGFNHHITLVVRQIANLFGISTDGIP